MLKELVIKNIGLIDEQKINFKTGLNILTGETGSGKSMIINAINFLSGEKISKLNIRKGCEEAFIEGVFLLREKNFAENLGIEIAEDNLLIVSRKYISGHVTNRINGRIVTVGMLRQVSNYILEFYGQNESQKLLESRYHLEILDRFCADKIAPIKKNLNKKLKEMREKKNSLTNLMGESNFDEKIMMLEFQIKEISDANLSLGEEKDLQIKYKKLTNAKILCQKISEVIKMIYEDENFSAHNIISHSSQILEEIKNDDPALNNIYDTIKSIEISLGEARSDLFSTLSSYQEILNSGLEQMHQIEKRLDFLYELTTKYKKNIDELIEYLDFLNDQHEILINSREKILILESDIQKLKNETISLCEKLTEIRHSQSKKICLELEKVLNQLDIPNAKLEMRFKKKTNFNENGIDETEFFISTNAGEDLKLLAKFISGGETSRIMLALKSIFAKFDSISTLIFDEIDTGIGGKTAQVIAEKLKNISRNCQIICITHLAQIATIADEHLLVEKYSDINSTKIKISSLDKNQKTKELARMLTGKKITANILKTVYDMQN